MNHIFAKIMNCYPREVFIYMDDVLNATGDDLERHQKIVQEIL
jgi:hypothetical protein